LGAALAQRIPLVLKRNWQKSIHDFHRVQTTEHGDHVLCYSAGEKELMIEKKNL
jgi:hypothetical protein